jgi:hypothetical protein
MRRRRRRRRLGSRRVRRERASALVSARLGRQWRQARVGALRSGHVHRPRSVVDDAPRRPRLRSLAARVAARAPGSVVEGVSEAQLAAPAAIHALFVAVFDAVRTRRARAAAPAAVHSRLVAAARSSEAAAAKVAASDREEAMSASYTSVLVQQHWTNHEAQAMFGHVEIYPISRPAGVGKKSRGFQCDELRKCS